MVLRARLAFCAAHWYDKNRPEHRAVWRNFYGGRLSYPYGAGRRILEGRTGASQGSADEQFIRKRLKRIKASALPIFETAATAGTRQTGERTGPGIRYRYRTPVFPIYRKGHYGSFIGRGFETLDDFRALVSEVKTKGGHFIKIMISGLMDFNRYGVLTDEPMPETLIRELTDIAHGEGFSVMAHANGDAAVRGAVLAGIDSVEHGAYLTDETLQMLAESRSVWVPTLVTIGNLIGDTRFPEEATSVLAYQMTAVRKAAEYGALIAPGSDAGAYRVFHGQGGLDELTLLRRALGDAADEILARGTAEIEARF